MPVRTVRRKLRHHSEPPLPSRAADSADELDADDNLDASIDPTPAPRRLVDAQAHLASLAAGSALTATNKRYHPSGFALDQQSSQVRPIGAKGRTPSTTTTTTTTGSSASTVTFPLTPTSAAGEGDRTMGSLAAGSADNKAKDSQKTGASENSRVGDTAMTHTPDPDDQHHTTSAPQTLFKIIKNTHISLSAYVQLQPVGLQPAEDKMSEQHPITNPSARPPPPDVPVIRTNNPSVPHSSLRISAHSSHSHANGSATQPSAPSPAPVVRTMSHRLENQSIRPRHFQDQHFHESHYYSAHPSPPPITTLTHSPSLSSDRSSVNSPAPTILPPLAAHPGQFQHQPYIASSAHRYPSSAQPGTYHHSHYYPNTVSPPEVFTTPAQSYAHAYSGGYAPPPPPFHHATDMSTQQYSVNPYATTGSLYGHGGHGGGGSGGYTPIYTDDASTKLSDRVRRRCFNCCTTDTSTWRRSSLNPGKVLCNKCGLFERTHSRPRPDQFPHKRAPLQMPTQSVAHNSVSAAQSISSTQSHAQSEHGSNAAPHSLPPTTGHPSLGTGYNHSALPQIQEWLRPNSGSASAGAANHAGTGSSSASSSASAGPSSRAHSASSAADNRHQTYAASSVPASGSGGAGETRSPQALPARLVKRSDSVNSDLVDNTTPPQRRSTQNLTPSPSPPPGEAVAPITGGTASTAGESSPRALPHAVSSGAETGKA